MSPKLNSFSALSGLVYSTDQGKLCPECEQPIAQCRCNQDVIPQGDGIVHIRRESKGRGGKTVTTVTGVLLKESELKELAKALKKRCGVGGSLKDGVIEIQGDQVDLLLQELQQRGFTCKKSGG